MKFIPQDEQVNNKIKSLLFQLNFFIKFFQLISLL